MASIEWSAKPYAYISGAVDLGTGNLRAAAQHVLAGKVPNEDDILSVKLPGVSDLTLIELKVVYDDDDNMLLGDEVSRWLHHNPGKENKLVEQMKLALCPQYRNEPVVQRVYEALGVKHNDLPAIEQVYTDLLRRCHDGMRQYTKSHYGSNTYPEGYWESIPIELQLTVPVMWDGPARGVMSNAARKAGFKQTALRSEPLSAAGRYIIESLKHTRSKVGDTYSFLDIGRGTGDISTVTIEQPEARSRHPRIIVRGESHGSLCGSQRINDLAWIDVYRWYKKKLDDRGIGYYEAHRQFTSCFENCKRQFPYSAAGYRIRFYGNGRGQGNESIFGELTEEQMEKWFHQATTEMCELVDRHFVSNPYVQRKACILTGGAANNRYIFDAISNHLESYGIPLLHYNEHFRDDEHPCSFGALQLFLEVPSATFPQTITLYVARAPRWNGTALPSDAWTGQNRDELLPIFIKDTTGEFIPQAIEMEFILNKREGSRLRFQLFSSEGNDREGQRPYSESGALQRGLLEWPVVSQDLDDLEGLDYELDENHDGYQFYSLRALISAKRVNERVEVKVQVLAHGEKLPSEQPHLKRSRGRKRKGSSRTYKPKVRFEVYHEIWAPTRNHEVQSAGQKRSAPSEASDARKAVHSYTSSSGPNYSDRRQHTSSLDRDVLGNSVFSDSHIGSTVQPGQQGRITRSKSKKQADEDFCFNLAQTAAAALNATSDV